MADEEVQLAEAEGSISPEADASPEADDYPIFDFSFGGGCLNICGIFFFLPGVLAVARRITGSIDGPSLLWGALFVFIGLGLFSLKSGMTFDKTEGRMTIWWSLFGFRKGSDFEIKGAKLVTVRPEERGENKEETVYLVCLEGDFGEPIEIMTSTFLEESRELAEDLSEYLQVARRDGVKNSEARRDGTKNSEALRDGATDE